MKPPITYSLDKLSVIKIEFPHIHLVENCVNLRPSAEIVIKREEVIEGKSVDSIVLKSRNICQRKCLRGVIIHDFSSYTVSMFPVSRELERHVVSTYIYPALLDPPPDLDFTNQYAFRPSGSCTAALIAILDDISDLLKTSDYVILIALDFSRAFDSNKTSNPFWKILKIENTKSSL